MPTTGKFIITILANKIVCNDINKLCDSLKLSSPCFWPLPCSNLLHLVKC